MSATCCVARHNITLLGGDVAEEEGEKRKRK